ncbi:MAG: biopolymer transporter ExbD [Pseudomonadota bacterium]
MTGRRTLRRKAEPTIALINIVFLMLIFFMVAGTLAPPVDGDLELVDTSALEGREPAAALVLMPDGTLRYRGAEVPGPEGYIAEHGAEIVRVMPDRNAPALALVQLGRDLRGAGAKKVVIVTEQVHQ